MLAACSGGEEDAPTTLMDGSRAREVPVELDGVDVAVLTTVRVEDRDQIDRGSAAGSCLSDFEDVRPVGPVVTRVGVASESVSFGVSSGRALAGCNNSGGLREANRRWCGSAYGRLYAGRLRDPRLSIVCQALDSGPVGFVWVTPSPATRYVSVEQPGYVEVYEVAGDLPIRVATTSGVKIEGSSATFDVLEHDAQGTLAREYRLEAAVAG
jgi:hypothetical protein